MKFDISKILEQYNKLNEETRYAIFGGIIILIVFLDVFFLVMAQWGSIADINDQIKKMSEDTQQILVDRQRIGQLRKNLEASRLQLSALSHRVRPIQEVPSILGIISSAANDNGVKIDQLAPDKAQLEVLKSTSDGRYIGLPIVIKAHGGYHMFGRFLNKLENEDMFFIMKDFIIQNGDKDVHTHFFSLTIEAVLVDKSPVTAQAKK